MIPGTPDFSKVRHDLRTPVNQIIGYCELMLEDETLPRSFIPDVERMLAGGRKLIGVLAEYFDEARFEERRRDQFKLHHDLRTPVNHVIGYSELLEELAAETPGVPPSLAKDLSRIRSAAEDWLAIMEEYLVPNAAGARAGHGAPGASPALFLSPAISVVTSEPRSAQPASIRGEGRVLVVDDDPANREIIVRRLQRQGYTVRAEDGGLPALRALRAEPFDLVLLDLMMPGLDGYQVLAHMKAEPALRDLPVLMISGLDQENGIARCIEAGADDYLTKPFNPVLLRARIGACLEKKRLRDHERAIHAALEQSQARLLAELAEAGSYVQSILPEPLKEGAIRAEWCFQPSAQLGGDAFGYHALPGGSWALYLIDVSGHGVGAALLSVSAVNVLRTASVWEDAQGSPSDVLAELNRVFPMERHNQQFFTAWIGVYDPRRGVLSFSSAGHPPAVLFGAGPDRVELRTNGLPVGALPDAAFRTGEVAVPGGAELFVFSDGVYEIPLSGTATGTLQEFVDHLRQARENPQFRPDEMLAWARARAKGGHLDDDFSLMRIRFGVG